MKSSDFTVSSNLRALFRCDGSQVVVKFIVNDSESAPSVAFSRTEAVEIGRQIAKDGLHERFPISYVGRDNVQAFGERLMRYGMTGE